MDQFMDQFISEYFQSLTQQQKDQILNKLFKNINPYDPEVYESEVYQHIISLNQIKRSQLLEKLFLVKEEEKKPEPVAKPEPEPAVILKVAEAKPESDPVALFKMEEAKQGVIVAPSAIINDVCGGCGDYFPEDADHYCGEVPVPVIDIEQVAATDNKSNIEVLKKADDEFCPQLMPTSADVVLTGQDFMTITKILERIWEIKGKPMAIQDMYLRAVDMVYTERKKGIVIEINESFAAEQAKYKHTKSIIYGYSDPFPVNKKEAYLSAIDEAFRNVIHEFWNSQPIDLKTVSKHLQFLIRTVRLSNLNFEPQLFFL